MGNFKNFNHITWQASVLELGQCRFFKSVSVFGFLVVFSKVGIGFDIGFSKYRDIGFGFPTRTYRCLSNNTIADTIRPPLSPEWGLGPRITTCGHKR